MRAFTLPDVSGLDAKQMEEARRQLRSAALWPARIAMSYAPDAAPALSWNGERNAIVTPVFENSLQVELRPADLSMQFLDRGQPVPHVIELDDRSPAHVEAWILVELLHRGVDRDRFSKALPFEAPELLSGDHEKFATIDYPHELAAIDTWMRTAAAVLQRLSPGAIVSVGLPDVSLRVPLRAGGTGAGSGRAVVFSLGDQANPEPYFAVIRETVGTVTPLRPDVVLPLSQMHKQGMNEDAVIETLAGGGARGAA